MKSPRRYSLHILHEGLSLEAEIVYNSKSYHVALIKPFYARNSGSSLMYMIPARYTTPLDHNRDSDPHGIIRLEERAPQEIIALYECYKDHSFEHYVEDLLGPHQESLYELLKPDFLRIDQHKHNKKHIKTLFARNEISNKEQSQRIQLENQHIRSCIYSQEAIQTQYFQNHNIVIPNIHLQDCKDLIERWHAEKKTTP